MSSHEKQIEERQVVARVIWTGKPVMRTVAPQDALSRRAYRDAPDGVSPKAPMPEIRGSTSLINATLRSTLLLPADPRRKFLFIQNNDPVGNAQISFGVAATMKTGMKLAAVGGGVLLDNNVPTTDVYIIGDVADNSNITMVVA